VTGGRRLTEFRLRVGFLVFSPLFVAGLHLPAIRDITRSPAMAPWRIGGSYDRPIPRRILEQAGIPRVAFGVRKSRTAYFVFKSARDLSPAGLRDFQTYLRSMPRRSVLRRIWHRSLIAARAARDSVVEQTAAVWPGADRIVGRLVPVPWRYRAYGQVDFLAHWAQARIRERYREAAATRTRQAGRTCPPTA
jgi:hypothetical protein